MSRQETGFKQLYLSCNMIVIRKNTEGPSSLHPIYRIISRRIITSFICWLQVFIWCHVSWRFSYFCRWKEGSIFLIYCVGLLSEYMISWEELSRTWVAHCFPYILSNVTKTKETTFVGACSLHTNNWFICFGVKVEYDNSYYVMSTAGIYV
jgi:hypothetical protein